MRDDMVQNITRGLSIFADYLEAIAPQSTDALTSDEYPYVIDDLMSYFPLDKVDEEAGTYDQYM